MLGGTELIRQGSTKLTYLVDRQSGSLQVGDNWIAYYDAGDNALVFLNGKLMESGRLKMPEGIRGGVWLAPDRSKVYYCTEGGIQVLDLASGISRQLVEQKETEQTLSAILLDGQALRCDYRRADGVQMTRVIATATGKTMWEGRYVPQISTSGTNWLLKFDRGSVVEWICGMQGAGSKNLWPGTDIDEAVMLADGSVVTVAYRQWGTQLDRYEIAGGKRTASVKMAGITQIRDIVSDGAGGLWLLAQEVAAARPAICHWNVEMSAVTDAAVYTAPHYTAAEPDAAGIDRMNGMGAQLEEKYGVDILLGAEASAVVYGGYGFETEYLVQAMEKFLPRLDQALSLFPEGFLRTAAERTNSGRLRICLVRGIYGGKAYGTMPVMPCAQFWQDGEAYLMIAMDADFEESVFHAVMHVAQTRVLSVSTAYYDWDKLNPEGFDYCNDYVSQVDGRWLTGEDRAFVDSYGKRFSREDMAQIFAYACMPGNEDVFRTQTMQKKLQVLCEGLRQAFDLSDKCVWEQYIQ